MTQCVARGRAFLNTALKETRRVAPLMTDHPFTSSTTPPRPKEEDYKTRGRDGRGRGTNPLNFFSHFKQFLDYERNSEIYVNIFLGL